MSEGDQLTQVIAITELPEELFLVQIGKAYVKPSKGGRK